MEKLLEVKDLKVSFFTDLGETQAVKVQALPSVRGIFRDRRRVRKRKERDHQIHSPSRTIQL